MAFFRPKSRRYADVFQLGKTVLVLFLTFTVAPAFAQKEVEEDCQAPLLEILHQPKNQETQPVSKLTLEQAKKIVGRGVPFNTRELVEKAYLYMETQEYETIEHAAADLQILLEAVTYQSRDRGWKFEPLLNDKGYLGYIGTAGHYLVIHPDGMLHKGLIDPYVFGAQYPVRLEAAVRNSPAVKLKIHQPN